MTDDFNPTRPKWDVSKSGAVPDGLAEAFAASGKIAHEQEKLVEELDSLTPEQRFERLEAMQTEVALIANSPAQSYMTADQDFIYGWQRTRDVAQGSLDSFSNPEYQVEDRERKIEECKRTLATAFYKLGQIEAAKAVAMQCVSWPELVEPAELLAHINKVEAALNYPDGDIQSHACPRPPGVDGGKEIAMDRRWDSERVWSVLHGKLAFGWICRVCGLWNFSPEIPERQQQMTDAVRQQIHNEILAGRSVAQFEAGVTLAK